MLKKVVLQNILEKDNKDVRDSINKSVTTICKEKGVSYEQVFSIFYFLMRSSISNHKSFKVANSF